MGSRGPRARRVGRTRAQQQRERAGTRENGGREGGAGEDGHERGQALAPVRPRTAPPPPHPSIPHAYAPTLTARSTHTHRTTTRTRTRSQRGSHAHPCPPCPNKTQNPTGTQLSTLLAGVEGGEGWTSKKKARTLTRAGARPTTVGWAATSGRRTKADRTATARAQPPASLRARSGSGWERGGEMMSRSSFSVRPAGRAPPYPRPHNPPPRHPQPVGSTAGAGAP